jgi:aminomethyltransferase
MVAKTSLCEQHQRLGAKMVDFGGWYLPVSFGGSVLEEHHWVRSQCGIFDVSHMGEVFIEGPGSLEFLQQLTTNDVTRLGVGQGQYTAMCHENGGMVDDLIVYRLGHESYLAVVNAANIEKDFAWMLRQPRGPQVQLANRSAEYSQIAVQGPKSEEVLRKVLGDGPWSNLKYMELNSLTWRAWPLWLARTGYTGELGYEIYLPNDAANTMWETLLEQKDAVRPIGLGARDTLRLESCYLLYGQDMNDSVSPLEAGIAWATKIDKGPFSGREALISQKEKGIARKNMAFVMMET